MTERPWRRGKPNSIDELAIRAGIGRVRANEPKGNGCPNQAGSELHTRNRYGYQNRDLERPRTAYLCRRVVLRWATLCEKTHDQGLPMYVTENAYQTTLVFCSAPNASPPKHRSRTSSMRRTYSSKANKDKTYFDAGVAWAVYTALYASALSGCDTVFLPFVGGGVYAGPHAPNIEEFSKTVNRMLHAGRLPDGTRVPALGRCFRRVAIIVLPP
jgi:hypothetical protein